MGTKLFKQLPASVRSNLLDCLTEDSFDERRFNCIVGEHFTGLAAGDRARLLDAVYRRYARRHPKPPKAA